MMDLLPHYWWPTLVKDQYIVYIYTILDTIIAWSYIIIQLFFSQNHIVSLWSVTNVQGLGTSGVGHTEQNVASSIYRLFNHSQGSLTVLKYNNKVVIGNIHLKHTVARLLWFLLLYELLGKKDIVHKQHNNANKSSKVFTWVITPPQVTKSHVTHMPDWVKSEVISFFLRYIWGLDLCL